MNPTPVCPEAATNNLIEELADVACCALVLFGEELPEDDEDNIAEDVMNDIERFVEVKHSRWLERLEKNRENLSESEETLVEQDCPHCHNDVVMVWDVEMNGYTATCPFCGEELQLCNVCQHPYPAVMRTIVTVMQPPGSAASVTAAWWKEAKHERGTDAVLQRRWQMGRLR